jgi:hypothetical protein
MIQVDLPASFVIGQAFAMLSKSYLQKENDLFTSKLLGPFNMYLSCGFATGGLFLLVGWPAWEYMYVAPWIENVFDHPLIAAFYILFVIAMIMIGNAGYILGHYWYKTKRDQLVVWGLISGLILTFLPFLLKWGIWNQIGTYAEITAGEGYPFGEAPFFHGWLGIMTFMVLSGVLFGLWFRAKSKKLSSE